MVNIYLYKYNLTGWLLQHTLRYIYNNALVFISLYSIKTSHWPFCLGFCFGAMNCATARLVQGKVKVDILMAVWCYQTPQK